MSLPSMVYSEKLKNTVQVKFGGYNHTPAAKDGELYDMTNLSSRRYPLITPRPPRLLTGELTAPNGIFARDALCWVDGTSFYYGGAVKGTVADSQKTFAAMGAYIVILPDKKYYNVVTDTFGGIESAWSGASLTFTNGLLYDEEANANTVQCAGVTWSDYFKAGDAVTIAGCTIHAENNKTPVIREIDGDKLYFYEYVFILDGVDGNTPYTETGALSISRTMPDVDIILENENRLWGCRDDTIYASKLGDIFNWNVFDGLTTDSYAAAVGSAGDFTGAVSFLGYPVFFKEEHIYKVYGDIPSNFQVIPSASLGVADGSGGSLAIAGETLFYLSRAGVMAYAGGIPSPVGAAFGGVRYKNAVGGTDGLKYYVSMQDDNDAWHLFVFDTQARVWHREDSTRAVGFAFCGNLYFLTAGGDILIGGEVLDAPAGATAEASVAWSAEFADFTDETPYKKGVSKLRLRMEIAAGASVSVYIRYDGGSWQLVRTITGTAAKKSYVLPVVPRRCDHYGLKLTGTGECTVYSVDREYYVGSDV